MLPPTFEKEPSLRVGQAVIGIFAVALLSAGFSLTALACFAAQNHLFNAKNVLFPALVSCALGLLTIFYDFLVFNRYKWTIPALLAVVVAGVSTIVYAGLLFHSERKLALLNRRHQLNSQYMDPHTQGMHGDHLATYPQNSPCYENYNRNMFPTAFTGGVRHPVPAAEGYSPSSLTEEEMQRQQLLMLLLPREQPVTSENSAGTFRIEWQGNEEEQQGHIGYRSPMIGTPSGTDDQAPINGFYAPRNESVSTTQTPLSAYPGGGTFRTWAQELRPWDGVWRDVR